MSGLKIDKSEANLEKTLFSTLLVFFKKWANPGLFFVYFQSLQTNNTILTTNQCEKMLCPSSMRHWDSNPRTSEYESPPITTSPGLVFAFETCVDGEREILSFRHPPPLQNRYDHFIVYYDAMQRIANFTFIAWRRFCKQSGPKMSKDKQCSDWKDGEEIERENRQRERERERERERHKKCSYWRVREKDQSCNK